MSLELTLKNLEFNFRVNNPQENKIFEFADFRLDAGTLLLYRSGEQVVLTPKAVETLIALVANHGKVVSKDELMQTIWSDTIVEESNLAQYLHVLRKTLGDTLDGKPYIETLKRRGYRFNGKVRVVSHKSADEIDTENNVAASNGQPNLTTVSGRGNDGRGNAQALSHATKLESQTAPRVNVERLDNVFSVTDWRREPAVDTAQPTIPPDRAKWLVPISVVAAFAVVFAGISFGIYKFSTAGSSAAARSVPFLGSDMSRLTTSGKSKSAAISPDGRYVAHITAGAEGAELLR